MSNPVFSDYELRRLLSQHTFRSQHPEGGDTVAYQIAKFVRKAVEEKVYQHSLEKVWAESVPWQEETFPNATTKSVVEHLYREALELRENPDDWEEVADILLLLGHLIHKTGMDAAKVVRDKLEVNKRRVWAAPDEQGVVEHVREDEDPRLLINVFKDDPSPNPLAVLGDVYAPPAEFIYEIDEEGRLTGRRMIFYNCSGGPHTWLQIAHQEFYSERDRKVLEQKASGVIHAEGQDPQTALVRYLRRTDKVST